MKKTTSVKWGDVRVGLLIMIASAVLLWVSLFGGGTSIFDKKGKFRCYFENISGLTIGSPLWMSGVEVGNVSSISFVNLDAARQVEVVCRVKMSVWKMITEDSRVQLGTIGLLGDRYVEVIPGTTGKPAIEEMSVVKTEIVDDASALFRAGREAFQDAGAVVSGIDTLLSRINRGQGTMGQLAVDDNLYKNMVTMTTRLSKLLGSLQKNQERIVSSIEQTAESVASLSKKVDGNSGSLGKLINDPALYDNLAGTSARLDSIMSRINAAEGSLGLAVNDTALYVEIVNLVTRVNNLVTDIQENPRKYFKFSVF